MKRKKKATPKPKVKREEKPFTPYSKAQQLRKHGN